MAEKEKINPVTLDIVKDSLIAVSNEIFYAFAQTSMSPIIYETLDYASGIADAEGRLLPRKVLPVYRYDFTHDLCSRGETWKGKSSSG